MTDDELAQERKVAHDKAAASVLVASHTGAGASSPVLLVLAWSAVGIPLLCGIWITLQKALILFH